jgi:tetratricopeptide (TPR) repeat protein
MTATAALLAGPAPRRMEGASEKSSGRAAPARAAVWVRRCLRPPRAGPRVDRRLGKGTDVTTALLVELYRQLPEREEGDDPQAWLERFQAAGNTFKRHLSRRYNEGTLQRLLDNADAEARQAAALALGMLGTLASNRRLAELLHDDDERVRQLAASALWAVWFRADGEDGCKELQRLARLPDRGKALAGLNFQLRQFERAIADCETVLALNPYHFGAQVGMAQCLMQMRRHRAALKAFRRTRRLHPTLEGVEETIRALEEALGEGGTRDDKK